VYFNNGKISEAYSLWTEADRCLQICKSKDKMNDSIFSLKAAYQLVRVGKLSSWIDFNSKNETAVREVEQGVGSLQIKDITKNRLTL
jgi:hypothetical protein